MLFSKVNVFIAAPTACTDGTTATTEAPAPVTTTEAPEECSGVVAWINDAFCDDENNNAACDFDGGDCCLPRRHRFWFWYCQVITVKST